VIGNLQKQFGGPAIFTFPVGTANGYSPLDVAITAGSGTLNVRAVQGVQPALAANGLSNTSLQRFWTLNGSGITTDLTFNYLAGDVMGNESNYKIIRVSGSTPATFGNTSADTVNHKATVSGISSFSDWTLGTPLTPTASSGAVAGRIVDSNGNPVEGAVVRLSGTQNRKFITDAAGFYRFENVETNGFYTIAPSRVNYSFSPSARSFSQIGSTTEATFGATLSSSNLVNPLDTSEYFVRQHYLDFLGREPDEAGFNFWSDQILECGNDNACSERRRENVSAAYFLSIEFQQTGGLVDGVYRASYGRQSGYAEFMPDTRAVGLGVVVGAEGWQPKLQANKQEFVNAFINRAAFHAAYDGMANSLFVQYVDCAHRRNVQ
jgi:hypothetical protein